MTSVGVTEQVADQAAVDAVLTASRTLIAVATQSLGAAAEDTTIAQYRALVVLASPVQVSVTAAGREVVDQATARRRALIAGILAKLPAVQQSAVAAALESFAAAAGEIPDRQWPAGPAAPPAVPPARTNREPARAGGAEGGS